MSIENNVLVFVKNIFGKKISKDDFINFGKFKLSDLEAEYFMYEFFTYFNIESSDYKFEKYFDYDTYKNNDKIEISVNHLIKVAEHKKWFNPN